jgi:hypothetical protein
VLVRHRSALAAVAAAGLLVALAASSGLLASTAAASSALKDELVDLTPFATGLQITGLDRASTPKTDVDAREQAIQALGARLGLDRPVFTLETGQPLTLSTSGGDVPLNLLARTDVLDHVEILRRTGGPGVWVSDATARIARLAPGGTLKLAFSERGGDVQTVSLRVKGIYRALDATSPGPYWMHFLREIFPPGADPPPPAHCDVRVAHRARTLSQSFARLRSQLRRSGRPSAARARRRAHHRSSRRAQAAHQAAVSPAPSRRPS